MRCKIGGTAGSVLSTRDQTWGRPPWPQGSCPSAGSRLSSASSSSSRWKALKMLGSSSLRLPPEVEWRIRLWGGPPSPVPMHHLMWRRLASRQDDGTKQKRSKLISFENLNNSKCKEKFRNTFRSKLNWMGNHRIIHVAHCCCYITPHLMEGHRSKSLTNGIFFVMLGWPFCMIVLPVVMAAVMVPVVILVVSLLPRRNRPTESVPPRERSTERSYTRLLLVGVARIVIAALIAAVLRERPRLVIDATHWRKRQFSYLFISTSVRYLLIIYYFFFRLPLELFLSRCSLSMTSWLHLTAFFLRRGANRRVTTGGCGAHSASRPSGVLTVVTVVVLVVIFFFFSDGFDYFFPVYIFRFVGETKLKPL